MEGGAAGQTQGMSIRRMAGELGTHRNTVRRYTNDGSPPTRRTPVTSTVPPTDAIAGQTGDISAELRWAGRTRQPGR